MGEEVLWTASLLFHADCIFHEKISLLEKYAGLKEVSGVCLFVLSHLEALHVTNTQSRLFVKGLHVFYKISFISSWPFPKTCKQSMKHDKVK